MNIIICKPLHGDDFKPDGFLAPFAGSPEAKDAGCLCPEQKQWPRRIHFAEGCPIHALRKTSRQ